MEKDLEKSARRRRGGGGGGEGGRGEGCDHRNPRKESPGVEEEAAPKSHQPEKQILPKNTPRVPSAQELQPV